MILFKNVEAIWGLEESGKAWNEGDSQKVNYSHNPSDDDENWA